MNPPESGYTSEGIKRATVEQQAAINNAKGNEPQDKPGAKNEQAINAQANAMHDNASQADADTYHGHGHARHRYWGLEDNVSNISESRY